MDLGPRARISSARDTIAVDDGAGRSRFYIRVSQLNSAERTYFYTLFYEFPLTVKMFVARTRAISTSTRQLF